MNERNKPVPARAQKTEAAAIQPLPTAAAPSSAETAPAAAATASPEQAPADERGPGQRVPFGAQRQKLEAPARRGYVRRWFNDEPGRIQKARDAGYAHVLNERQEPTSYTVGVAKMGGGQTAYLMEIPEEFYAQDQAAKMAAVDEIDAQIKRGAVNGEPGTDGKYVPIKPDGRPVIDSRQPNR